MSSSSILKSPGVKQASKQVSRQASTRKAFSQSHALEGLVLDGEEETMQIGGEDERREDNTAAGEEETTFTTNTEVSNNMCNGHHISASVHQVCSSGASSSNVVINVEQE